MGIAGLLLSALAFMIIREPPRQLQSAEKPPALIPLFSTLWKTRSFRAMALGMAFGFHRSGDSLGAVGVGGVFGTLLLGVVADRVAKRGPLWMLYVAAAASLSATLLILAVTWAPSIETAQMLAIPSGLLGGGWSVGIMSALQFVLPDRFRATGTA